MAGCLNIHDSPPKRLCDGRISDVERVNLDVDRRLLIETGIYSLLRSSPKRESPTLHLDEIDPAIIDGGGVFFVWLILFCGYWNSRIQRSSNRTEQMGDQLELESVFLCDGVGQCVDFKIFKFLRLVIESENGLCKPCRNGLFENSPVSRILKRTKIGKDIDKPKFVQDVLSELLYCFLCSLLYGHYLEGVMINIRWDG